MATHVKSWLAVSITAGVVLLGGVTDSTSQAQQRYEPSRPTISPYMNLFQNNNNNGNGQFNRALPNYYSLVRPLQQQYQTNQIQQQLIQQQNHTIGQLQSNVQLLQRQQQAGQPVLTGHGSWFDNSGTRTKFLDTSRYYSRAGTGANAPRR